MMLTVKEATKFLRNHRVICSERTVRRWLQQGVIQGIPPASSGDKWRIRLSDLLLFRGSLHPEEHDSRTRTEALEDENYQLRSENERLMADNEELKRQLGIPLF